MTGIEAWSTTAASNNSSPPNGWPEGQAPSTVNDCARQMMASVRNWYENAQWINFGYTHTYASGTSFTIAGTDVTTIYAASRRVKAVGSSTGTIYGAVSSSSFSTNTTVNITWDSGSLSNETLTVYIGIITPTNNALPATAAAPFIDSTAIIKGSGDATKLLKIEVDGFTTGTTRTLTPQDKSYTIADNADFAAKANLASPTFTGTPAAPTAASATNTTQIATTAFAFGALTASATGSITFANGLIVKWGVISGASDGTGTQTVNFAVAFPNNCWWVVPHPAFTSSAATSPSVGYFQLNSISTSGFVCTYTSNRYWLAIGN